MVVFSERLTVLSAPPVRISNLCVRCKGENQISHTVIIYGYRTNLHDKS